MYKYLIGIVISIIVIVAGYIALKPSTSSVEETKKDIVVSTSTKVSNFRMVSIATTTDYTEIDGEYPQFSNASNVFNAKISNAINLGIKDQYEASKENWKARYDTQGGEESVGKFPKADEKFGYNASSTIVRNDSSVISVVIRVYEYSGGAHGSEVIHTFNYDLINQREIELTTLIQKDKDLLKKLSTTSRTLLLKDLATRGDVPPDQIDKGMLNDGTEPLPENFSLFTLPNDKEITFYFIQYQVAAYVFGSSELTIPYPVQ